GTTIRVQRILNLLGKWSDLTLITCSDKAPADSKETGSPQVLSIKGISAPPDFPGKHILSKVFAIIRWNFKMGIALFRSKPEVIYCSHDWYGFPGVYLISKIRRAKVVYEVHSIFSEESEELGYKGILLRLMKLWEKMVIQHSHIVIAVSKNIYDFYNPYNRKMHIIPGFVNPEIYKKSGGVAAGKARRERLIGLIGPFNNAFNDYFLEFINRSIGSLDQRIKFVAIGKFEEKIENERIEYTGYLDSVDDYIDRLSHLDALLVPSRVATSGPLTKIMEAMSCSLPVFTTPKGTVGLDWIKPGVDILVFEENEIVDKINELIFDDELMLTVGENARKAVKEYYSAEINEEKLHKILAPEPEVVKP
ncbi:glycosyltransferase family 4 protein, partial [bacterium]|nr:glycosyltransferase family 4 protein [bacterium]